MAKKIKLQTDPLMILGSMAIFAMMPILFTMVNAQNRARETRAAAPEVVVATPSPSSSPAVMYTK